MAVEISTVHSISSISLCEIRIFSNCSILVCFFKIRFTNSCVFNLDNPYDSSIRSSCRYIPHTLRPHRILIGVISTQTPQMIIFYSCWSTRVGSFSMGFEHLTISSNFLATEKTVFVGFHFFRSSFARLYSLRASSTASLVVPSVCTLIVMLGSCLLFSEISTDIL